MSSSSTLHLKQLLGRAKPMNDFAFESMEAAALDIPDTLHRVESKLRNMPADEIGDPSDFERALNIFLKHAETGLRQLDRGAESINGSSRIALEAVIRTDGSRPSFLIKNGTIDPNHPLAGQWKEALIKELPGLEKRIGAVGRIEPAAGSGHNFFGTGWLVKSDPERNAGLILTNLHVLEEMRIRLANAVLPNGKGGFQFLGDNAFIDFIAESGSLEKKRFRIVEGTPSGVDGAGYLRLDAAVLKIVPMPEPSEGKAPTFPEPIPVIPDIAGAQGELGSFCVVGYPGAPPYSGGFHEGVDWIWVNSTLFGGRFGVKRLAPGNTHKPLGEVRGDSRQWVFGHDATTLGGNSGSPVIAWLDESKAGFGLHFAGATVDSNYAHALGRMEPEIEKLGVPFVKL